MSEPRHPLAGVLSDPQSEAIRELAKLEAQRITADGQVAVEKEAPKEPQSDPVTKPGLETLVERPSPVAPTERWATLACFGTLEEYRSAGEAGHRSNVQIVYDLMPEPRFQIIGLGKRRRLLGKVFGGLFGTGVARRVREIVEWLDSHSFDRLMIVAGSRGAAIAGGIIREMERRRDVAWREGKDPSSWCHVDVLVLLDPVLSVGFNAPAKWVLKFVPEKVAWNMNIDRFRTLPPFVHVQIALYSLHETRREFEATHYRLTHPQQHTWRRYLTGVHSTILGYGPGEDQNADARSWLRKALSLRIPMLQAAPWPCPEIDPREWEESEAKPTKRRTLPGDLQVTRRKGASEQTQKRPAESPDRTPRSQAFRSLTGLRS